MMDPDTSTIINCSLYQGKKAIIYDLRDLILSKYDRLFHSVLVHGSISTDDTTPYSDFDGLLIIKDKFTDSILLGDFLYKSKKIINKYDPLQHHYWFSISESQLSNYPYTYLPVETLLHSKTIYPISSIKIHLKISSSNNYVACFENLSDSLLKKINKNFRPRGAYQLKSFLSEIMLLPTAYYQAKYNQGIYKKYSFTAVCKEFSPEAWLAIEKCTNVRDMWACTYWFPSQLFSILKDVTLFKKYVRKYLSPFVNNKIQNILGDNFNGEIYKLIFEMKYNLSVSKNI